MMMMMKMMIGTMMKTKIGQIKTLFLVLELFIKQFFIFYDINASLLIKAEPNY